MAGIVKQSSDTFKRSRASDYTEEKMNVPGHERSKRRRFSRQENHVLHGDISEFRENSSPSHRAFAAVEATQLEETDKTDRYSQAPWSLLQAVGGRYSDLDPVFSVEEK